jgi:predicted DNA-binding protein
MPTKNPRLIVTLEPSLYAKVKSISKTNGTTLSMAARDLIREACGDIEDLGLSVLADKRMKSGKVRRWLKHDEVWK